MSACIILQRLASVESFNPSKSTETFRAAPYWSLVTWAAGRLMVLFGILSFLFSLWRTSIKGEPSPIDGSLLGGLALPRYLVGGIQELMVPAMILLFFLGANSIAQVVVVLFIISLFGQILISIGLFAVAPSKEVARDTIDTMSG